MLPRKLSGLPSKNNPLKKRKPLREEPFEKRDTINYKSIIKLQQYEQLQQPDPFPRKTRPLKIVSIQHVGNGLPAMPLNNVIPKSGPTVMQAPHAQLLRKNQSQLPNLFVMVYLLFPIDSLVDIASLL